MDKYARFYILDRMQIYEKKIFDLDKALKQYMRILDEYPSSIFSEPIRYHIRDIKQLES